MWLTNVLAAKGQAKANVDDKEGKSIGNNGGGVGGSGEHAQALESDRLGFNPGSVI